MTKFCFYCQEETEHEINEFSVYENSGLPCSI